MRGSGPGGQQGDGERVGEEGAVARPGTGAAGDPARRPDDGTQHTGLKPPARFAWIARKSGGTRPVGYDGYDAAVGIALAVDLGTSHTVAIVARDGQAPRPVVFDSSPLLPSGVYRQDDGTLVVGRDAQRLASFAPESFEPHPKRRIDDGAILLGDAEIPVVELLAALLGRVVAETGRPDRVALCCPADWGAPRREILRAAARQAGLGEVELVPEPVAAAAYYARMLGQPVPPGRSLLVFDFGGGTVDVAVVDGARIAAVGGLDDLGGVDVDAALVGHLGALIGYRDPALWQRLDAPADPAARRDRQAFWSEVRQAKEMLSRTGSAPVAVPGGGGELHLTRAELDRIAGPLVDRAIDEARRLASRVPLPVGAILLVGGASRMPLVATRLHARLGVAPTVPEQPELPVALGALLAAPQPAPAPMSPVPVSPVPMSPAPPMPVVARPATVDTPPWQRPAPVPAVGPAKRTSHGWLVPVVAAVVVLALLSGLAWWGSSTLLGLFSGVENNASASGAENLHQLGAARTIAGSGTTAVAAGDGSFYYAAGGASSTVVAAIRQSNGKQRWRTTLPVAPAEVSIHQVDDVLIVDAGESASDAGKDMREVLDAATGHKLWSADWSDHTDLMYVGGDVVTRVEATFTMHTARYSLRTGTKKWATTASGDDVEASAEAALSWTKSTGTTAIPAAATPLVESLYADPGRVVELHGNDGSASVVNAATGTVTVRRAVPIDIDPVSGDDTWTVYDGLAIGSLTDSASPGQPAVAAYRLTDLHRAWVYKLAPGASVSSVRPCGQHVVCVGADADSDTLMGVRTGDGKAAWSSPITGQDADQPGCRVFGGVTTCGDTTFDSMIGTPGGANYTIDPATGRHRTDLKTPYLMAASGSHAIQIMPDSGGKWLARVVDLRTGNASSSLTLDSADLPTGLVLDGTALAVLTKNRLLYLAGKR